MTHTINESKYKGETFTIENVQDILDMKALVNSSGNKEPKLYTLKRVVEGTRKKKYTVTCFRFKSGQFISAF